MPVGAHCLPAPLSKAKKIQLFASTRMILYMVPDRLITMVTSHNDYRHVIAILALTSLLLEARVEICS